MACVLGVVTERGVWVPAGFNRAKTAHAALHQSTLLVAWVGTSVHPEGRASRRSSHSFLHLPHTCTAGGVPPCRPTA
jgi:hypothetical protein